MYKLGGVLLDNPSKGWYTQMGSEPYTGFSRDAVSLTIPGRDGVVGGLTLDRGPAILPLKMRMPASRLREFLALMDVSTKIATVDGLYEAVVEPLSASPSNLPTATPVVDVDCTWRVPSGVWRDVATTTGTPVPLTSGNITADVLPGLGAPVRDLSLRVKGPVNTVRIEDVRTNSWWSYPFAVSAGQSIIFTNGFAVLSNFADSNWDDYTTNVTDKIDYGGPRGRFELLPMFTGSDPANRKGQVRVKTTTPGSGAQFWYQGKGAYFV